VCLKKIKKKPRGFFVASFFSWPVVQLILNPAYFPITDVSEIGLFGEILPDESVGVFIQPFFPRMVGAAKIKFPIQIKKKNKSRGFSESLR